MKISVRDLENRVEEISQKMGQNNKKGGNRSVEIGKQKDHSRMFNI